MAVIVVAETAYVLESSYQAPRGQVAEAIRSLMAYGSIILLIRHHIPSRRGLRVRSPRLCLGVSRCVCRIHRGPSCGVIRPVHWSDRQRVARRANTDLIEGSAMAAGATTERRGDPQVSSSRWTRLQLSWRHRPVAGLGSITTRQGATRTPGQCPGAKVDSRTKERPSSPPHENPVQS